MRFTGVGVKLKRKEFMSFSMYDTVATEAIAKLTIHQVKTLYVVIPIAHNSIQNAAVAKMASLCRPPGGRRVHNSNRTSKVM